MNDLFLHPAVQWTLLCSFVVGLPVIWLVVSAVLIRGAVRSGRGRQRDVYLWQLVGIWSLMAILFCLSWLLPHGDFVLAAPLLFLLWLLIFVRLGLPGKAKQRTEQPQGTMDGRT